jgi:hypothetical protein
MFREIHPRAWGGTALGTRHNMGQSRAIINIRPGQAAGCCHANPAQSPDFGGLLDSSEFIVDNYIVIRSTYK